MLCSNSTVIQSGESVVLDIDWDDRNGLPSTPDSVEYQVFDQQTETSVSALVVVTPTASTMEILVPAGNLPGSTARRHGLVIQVKAEFPGGEIVIESVRLWVERIPAFS